MAYLFNIESKIVQPNAETLLIYPFSEIWRRDTSEKKEIALKEFTYIEFMSSKLKSNPYKGYQEEARKKKILNDINFPGFIEDDLIIEGLKKINEFQTEGSSSYSFFMSARAANNKLQKFLLDFDMERLNPKTGTPIYKPKDISSALLDVDKVTTALSILEKKVEDELFEDKRVRAGKEISYFADPNNS